MKFDFEDLRRWADGAGIALRSEQLTQLRTYVDVLRKWNRRVNLVSQSDVAAILVKHIADSLIPSTLCREHEEVADLGSGAGLPGIPMAIARPDIRVTLIESNQKRVSFLAEALRLTSLTGARLVEARISAAGKMHDLQAAFTLVIARALGSLDELVRIAPPFLLPQGRLIAMKGRHHERELRGSTASEGFTLERIVPYTLPDGAERSLVIFRFT